MKKSKILMPLTGIATIGAIAPITATTSCGNKDTQAGDIFSDIYLANDGLIGQDEILSEHKTQNLYVVATLKNDFLAGHTFKYTRDASWSYSGVMSVEAATSGEITATLVAGKTYALNANNVITINTEKLTEFTQDESINITYLFEELDDKGATVNTQLVTLTATAIYGKESIPTIVWKKTEGDLIEGKYDSTTKKTQCLSLISSRKLIVAEPVNATLNFDSEVKITEKTTYTTLVLPKTQTVAMPTDRSAKVLFGGWIEGTFSARTIYIVPQETVIMITFSTNSDKYVAKTWTQGIRIPANTKIDIMT